MFGRNTRPHGDAETEREIRAHLDLEAEELRGEGLNSSEAVYAARRRFGNTTLVAEACREIAGRGSFARLAADIRQGLRSLLRKPSYAALSISTLAVGIAANAVIFSMVNGVLLKPLSYPNSDRIVTLLHGGQQPASPADFLDWKREARSFEDMQAASGWSAALTGAEGAERLPGLQITPGMFEMLGVHPALGRTFAAEHLKPGNDKVVILSHGLWQRRFGADPNVIGRTVRLSGASYTVIGVMPVGFQFTPFWVTDAELWSPLVFEGAPSRQARMLRVFGLLKPNTSIRQGQAEIDAIASRLALEYPDSNAGLTVAVEPLAEKVVGKVRTPLLVLLAAVGLVMLIACSNIASLTLARALGRRKEIGIRLALGAGRIRIVRQLLTESVLLSSLGGIAGVALSFWGLTLAKALIEAGNLNAGARLPRLDQVQIDWAVLAFTALLAILSGLVFGSVPALQASRFDVNTSLKDAGRGSSEGAGSIRLRGFLVMAEIAICLVLLSGAGVLLRSYLRLRAIDPGYDPRNVLTMTVSVAGREDYRGDRRDALYAAILEAARRVPGVESAGMTNHLPLGGDTWGERVAAEGAVLPRPGEEIVATWRLSLPGYFAAMKIPVIEGRDFSDFDRESAPKVAIVNEALARRLWPGQDAVGKRITTQDPRNNPEWLIVSGVVHNVRHREWTPEPGPEIYIPYAQDAQARNSSGFARTYITLVLRTSGDPLTLQEPVRRAIAGIDRELVVSQMRSFEQIISGTLWQARFSMIVILLFALFALLLACLGIYGVMSYVTGSRATEIGIRMALGANRRTVLAMIFRQGLTLALAGVAIGIAFALLLTRSLETFVYGVSTADPLTFLLAPTLLLTVAALAVLIPALRASAADPAQTLRANP
jgi:predicted permease